MSTAATQAEPTGPKNIRNALLGFAVTLVALVTVVLSAGLWMLERREVDVRLDSQAMELAGHIESVLNTDVRAIRRMADQWVVQEGTPFEVWRADATRHVQDSPALRTLGWLDSAGTFGSQVPVWSTRERERASGIAADAPDAGLKGSVRLEVGPRSQDEMGQLC